MIKKILTLFGTIIISFNSMATDSTVDMAKKAFSEDFIYVTDIKKLDNGNKSVLLKVFDKTCLIELNNKNETISKDCDESTSDDKLLEIKQVYAALLEDTLVRGYCDYKMKQDSIQEGVKNRCLYAEYVTLSNCVDEDNCKDFSQWILETKHKKDK
jgi:hypothetical protein